MLISRDTAARRHDGATTTFLTVLMAGLLMGACGGTDDPSPPPGGAPTNPGGGGAMNPGAPAATFDLQGCVVSVLATDCGSGLPAPHEVELLNAATGEPLPGFTTRSASGGKYSFKDVPSDVELAIHAIGVGAAEEGGSTYDSIAFYNPAAGDELLRVSSVGTAGLAGMTAAFTPSQDRVALSGTVYQVNEQGRRIGTVGCAQVFVDSEPHPAARFDQRYNASSGIPTTLAKLQQTLASSGRFYFGNVEPGMHTLKVSMDGGKSFILERKLFLGKVRREASSPFKALLYLVGLDIKGANPTPAACPTEELR